MKEIPKIHPELEVVPSPFVIYFDTGITNDASQQLIDTLRDINRDTPTREIEIRINSNGGGLQAGMDVARQVKHMDNPITTICETRAMSAAALLLSSGDKGHRFAYEDATMMLHQVQFTINNFEGSAPELFHQTKRLLKMNREFMRELAGNMTIPFEELLKRTQQEWFMNAQEALEIGLIDAILPRPNKGYRILEADLENPLGHEGRIHRELIDPIE